MRFPPARNLLTITLVVCVLVRLGYAFARLFWLGPEHGGANDLSLRFKEATVWFKGKPVYGVVKSAVYPPASYTMMAPALALPTLNAARWFWTAISAITLAGLSLITVRAIPERSRLRTIDIVLFVGAMYAMGPAIGNGQVSMQSLLAALMALLILFRMPNNWRNDALAGLLLAMALIKPTSAVPFLLLPLIAGRWRCLLFCGLPYLAFAWVACALQGQGLVSLHQTWLEYAVNAAKWSSGSSSRTGYFRDHVGYGDLHSFAGTLRIARFNLYFTVGTLPLLAAWLFRNRRADLWVAIGVTGIVARMWTYHRVYDDLLLLPAYAALARLALADRARGLRGSTMLLAVCVAAALAPAQVRYWSKPFKLAFEYGQPLVWLAALAYLVYRAPSTRSSQGWAEPHAPSP